MTVKKDNERGTWYYVVDVPSPDGKRRQVKRRGFPTKKAALAAEAKVRTDADRGVSVRPGRITVERYLIEEWLPAKVPTLKPSTATSYRETVAAYIVPRIGGLALLKVDGGVLNAFYGDLLTNGRTGGSGRRGGLSPKTVRNIHGLLHRAFSDAVRWRRLAVNPCDQADQPRKDSPEMMTWTPAELGRFLSFTAEDRLGAVWRLFGTTGMRRGEVAGLRWSDVDLRRGTLVVRQTVTMVGQRPTVGTPKTAAGTRRIALDPVTTAALKRWKVAQTEERLVMGAGWQGGDDLVVTEPDGSSVHPRAMTRRFHAITKAAGLPCIRLHDVRHSYATAALGAGVSVKVLAARLGHADVSVTLRTYAHVLPGDDEAAAATVAAVLATPGQIL